METVLEAARAQPRLTLEAAHEGRGLHAAVHSAPRPRVEKESVSGRGERPAESDAEVGEAR